jgi:putative CocE/NonD family hydrolase
MSHLYLILILIPIVLLALRALWNHYRQAFVLRILGLPNPKYPLFIEKNIFVEMQDGIRLATDIYRPKIDEALPVIMLRTPYDKDSPLYRYDVMAQFFASLGYVVLVQDVRGKYLSEGKFQPLINEEDDGYDTIKWAAGQPWSNGKCGILGYSYLGSCAWLPLKKAPSALQTIIPMFINQNSYSAWIDKGVPYLKDMLVWLYKHHEKEAREYSTKELDDIIRQLPVIKLDSRLAKEMKTYQDWIRHVGGDEEFWGRTTLKPSEERVELPVLYVGGWFDKFVDDTIRDFSLTLARAEPGSLASKCRLIVGAWGHDPSQTFRELKFPKNADFKNQYVVFLKWFEIFLKDRPYDFDEANPIEYYLMGKNVWRQTSQWPPPETQKQQWYLNSKGNANTKRGDGELTESLPETNMSDSYIYDPDNPVPSIGSKMLYGDGWEGPREQSMVVSRHDVLVYQSPKLEADLTVTGDNSVTLCVSTTAPDTDFFVKVCDVYPNGKAYFIQSGYIRMRYLESLTKPLRIESGKVYKLNIPMGSIAHTFLKGHRLQLQVTSSDFPNHGRNLNTGWDNEFDTQAKKALQTVYHGPEHPSLLELTVFQD